MPSCCAPPAAGRSFDPHAQARIDRADAALALVAAIESGASVDLVFTAAIVLLGECSLAAHAEDVERIVQDGRLPLTVLMIERRRRDIAMMATTVALEVATVHALGGGRCQRSAAGNSAGRSRSQKCTQT